MISSLSHLIQNRKGKLVTYLNNNTDDLPLEKQHQIYGAITELEVISEILKGYREKEVYVENHQEEIPLFKPIQCSGFFNGMKNFLKDFF